MVKQSQWFGGRITHDLKNSANKIRPKCSGFVIIQPESVHREGTELTKRRFIISFQKLHS